MEQYSQYLMLVKNKNNINMNPYSSHSWEEQAFAEDARGPLGCFVWPPRSYPCSFCRREFRSAQALGGHMNVHRREKAKLKQTVSASATSIAPQNLNKASSRKESSRVSSIPVLGQESLDSNSDTKSCVYDEDFVVTHCNGDVETNLVLGFDLDSWSVSNCKRQKSGVTPAVMAGSMDGIDLELRLAS